MAISKPRKRLGNKVKKAHRSEFIMTALSTRSYHCFYVAVLLSIGATGSFGQETPYPYQDYGDRKEGILPYSAKLVAGEKIELITAAIESVESPSAAISDRCSLGFYSHSNSEIEIKVREIDAHYLMEPRQRWFDSGLQTYSWPATIVDYCQIKLLDLLPLGELLTPGKKQIVPIFIYRGKPLAEEVNYRFGFSALKSVRELTYEIFRGEELESLNHGQLHNLRANEIFYVLWNGRNSKDEPLASGLYTLSIQVRFQSLPGQLPNVVTLNLEFYHFRELFSSASW